MNVENARRTAAGSLRLLLLVVRHVAAPLVSLVISYATMIGSAIFIGGFHMGQVGLTLDCGVVGFFGVMAGARVLPKVSRRIGSVGLLLLGLIYFYYFVADWGDQITDEGKVINIDELWVARLIFLGLGGALAVFTVWRWPVEWPQKIA